MLNQQPESRRLTCLARRKRDTTRQLHQPPLDTNAVLKLASPVATNQAPDCSQYPAFAAIRTNRPSLLHPPGKLRGSSEA